MEDTKLEVTKKIIEPAKADGIYFEWRYSLVMLALIQSFLAAGIFYGWPSLYTMLLEEGIYHNRCPSEAVCSEQTLELGFIYTLGGCSNLAAQLLWGWVLDKKGPRVCSFLSVSMVFCGVLLLGITDNGFDVLPHAMIFIAVGGPGASISCFHLSNLFPESKNSVLSLFSGAFQLGFMVFMIFRELVAYFTRFQVCIAYAILLFVIIVIGLGAWPASSLTKPRDADKDEEEQRPGNIQYNKFTNSPSFIRLNKYADPASKRLDMFVGRPSFGGGEGSSSREPSVIDSPSEVVDTPPGHARATRLYRIDSDILQFSSVATPTVMRQVKRKKPLLWKELSSIPFAALCLWMTVALFWMNFYIGNVADQMFQQANGDKALAHQYTSYFTTILPLGAVAIPLYGFATDRLGLPFAVGLSTVFGAAFTTVCLLHNIKLQLITFVTYSLFRTFVFATFFSLVAKEFGYSSFGVISGLILCVAGLACLLQYPVRKYFVPDEDFGETNFVQLVSVLATGIAYSVYIAIHLRDSRPAAVKRAEEKKEDDRLKTYGSTGSLQRGPNLRKVHES